MSRIILMGTASCRLRLPKRLHRHDTTCILALMLILLPSIALAVTVTYDEAVWTKALWSSWKLDSPLDLLNPGDELPGLLKAAPAAARASLTSLDGPIWVRPPQHAPGGTTSLSEVEALEDQALLEPASQAAQCSVCHMLLTRAWSWASHEVLNGNTVTSTALDERLAHSCEKEVVDALLQKYTIYKMESNGGAKPLMFFVIRERKPGALQTAAERQAVRLSCKNLVKESGEDLSRVLMGALVRFQQQVAAVQSRRAPSTSSTDPAAPETVSVDGVELTDDSVLPDSHGTGDESTSGVLSGGAPAIDRLASLAGKDGGEDADQAGDNGLSTTDWDAAEEAGGDDGNGEDDAAAEQRAGGEEMRLQRMVLRRLRAAVGAAQEALHTGAANTGDTGDTGAADGAVSNAVLGGRGAGDAGGAGDNLGVQPDAALGAAPVVNNAQLRDIVQRAAATMGLEVEVHWPPEWDSSDAVSNTDNDDDENEDECLDLHIKCEEWAASGECERNPHYMQGHGTSPGHCRKSCGLCTPAMAGHHPPARPIDARLAAELEALGNALMQEAKNLGCAASGACLTGVAGIAWGGGLIKQQRAAGGFVLGKPFYGRAIVAPTPAAALAEAAASAAAGAVPAASQPETMTVSHDSDRGAEGQTPAESVLMKELSGKVLLLQTEFFVYEYAYRSHIRQYHEEPDGKVTENWSLGRFREESQPATGSLAGQPALLEDLDLIPELKEDMRRSSWPYIKQIYADGDVCVLAGGRRAVRRTEVRLACSPVSSSAYVLVREPDFCQYVYVVYLPALCQVDACSPRPRAALA